jgi:hypothetical protein
VNDRLLLSLLVLLLGVPTAALGWRLATFGLGLGSDFVIRYRGGGRADVKGRIPRSKVSEILEFCTRDLDPETPFSVRGTWGPNRRLQLRWSGRLDPSQRQRVRNFLVQCLD